MTAQIVVPRMDAAHPSISGELLDALIEAVVFPPDPRARSALICSLVQEICATVEWRQEGDEDGSSAEELISIRRLVARPTTTINGWPVLARISQGGPSGELVSVRGLSG